MKSLQESPALLTVHSSSPGNYIIRIQSSENRELLKGVIKLLEAESVVVITPNDIKLFHSQSNGTSQVVDTPVYEQPDPVMDMEAIARQESQSVPESEPVEGLPDGSQVVGETAQGTKVVRRRKTQGPQVAIPETCGRCHGHGRIQMLLDGGSSGEAACPVCHGSGELKRFGARR